MARPLVALHLACVPYVHVRGASVYVCVLCCGRVYEAQFSVHDVPQTPSHSQCARHSPTHNNNNKLHHRKQISILQFHGFEFDSHRCMYSAYYITLIHAYGRAFYHKQQQQLSVVNCLFRHLCRAETNSQAEHTTPTNSSTTANNTQRRWASVRSVWFNQRIHSIQFNLSESEGVCIRCANCEYYFGCSHHFQLSFSVRRALPKHKHSHSRTFAKRRSGRFLFTSFFSSRYIG